MFILDLIFFIIIIFLLGSEEFKNEINNITSILMDTGSHQLDRIFKVNLKGHHSIGLGELILNML